MSQSGICREQSLAAGREPECNGLAKGSGWAGFGTDRLKTAPPDSYTSGGSGVPSLHQAAMNVTDYFPLVSEKVKKKKKTINSKPFSFELCFAAYADLRAVSPCLFDLTNKIVLGLP